MRLLSAGVLIVLAMLQASPARVTMAGGGELTVLREADTLRISISGSRPGLAHLCVAERSRVRILHASAALGEGIYERDGDGWKLASGFDFKLRDRRTPPEGEKQAFFKSMGWLANADNSGRATREFSLRLTGAITAVAAAFLATDEPMAVSHWPAAVADDCMATKMVQGFLPPQARFNPAVWHRVQ
jgi:hypothetical protein